MFLFWFFIKFQTILNFYESNSQSRMRNKKICLCREWLWWKKRSSMLWPMLQSIYLYALFLLAIVFNHFDPSRMKCFEIDMNPLVWALLHWWWHIHVHTCAAAAATAAATSMRYASERAHRCYFKQCLIINVHFMNIFKCTVHFGILTVVKIRQVVICSVNSIGRKIHQ